MLDKCKPIVFLFAAFFVTRMKNYQGGLWIGLKRDGKTDQSFMWEDHSHVQLTDWAWKQPDRPSNKTSCVIARGDTPTVGRWDDVDCGGKAGFICEIYNGKFQFLQ